MRLIACIVLMAFAAAQQITSPCYKSDGAYYPNDPCVTMGEDCDPTTDTTFTCCSTLDAYLYCNDGGKVTRVACIEVQQIRCVPWGGLLLARS